MEINFTEPRWLTNYYHFIGALSIILNSFGIYLLSFYTNKLGNFRYYLLVFLVSCSLNDIQTTYFSQFIPLNPLIAGYTVGLLSGVLEPHTLLTFSVVFAVIQMECLLLCFEKKHQTIARLSKKHELHKLIRLTLYATWLVTPFNIFAWFSTLSLPDDQKFDFIMENSPELLQKFLELPNFDIYRKTTSFIMFFAVIILAGIVLNILFVICAYDIFKLMAGLKLRISPKRYQKHREAVISIMVQFGTSIICFVPPFFLAVLVMAHVGEAQFLIEIITAWYASHSSVNMLCLLYFFPPFRSFLISGLRKSKKAKPFISPVLVSVS